MRKPTRVFFLASFFGVKLNIALQVLMPTVAFPSPGSWSADRLCSTAEFPCHVWLAADVRASYSHCEDKQVGRVGAAFWPGKLLYKHCSLHKQFPVHSVWISLQGLLQLLSGFSEHHKPHVAGSTSGGQKDCKVAVWFLHEFSGCFCLSVSSMTVKFLLWIFQ